MPETHFISSGNPIEINSNGYTCRFSTNTAKVELTKITEPKIESILDELQKADFSLALNAHQIRIISNPFLPGSNFDKYAKIRGDNGIAQGYVEAISLAANIPADEAPVLLEIDEVTGAIINWHQPEKKMRQETTSFEKSLAPLSFFDKNNEINEFQEFSFLIPLIADKKSAEYMEIIHPSGVKNFLFKSPPLAFKKIMVLITTKIIQPILAEGTKKIAQYLDSKIISNEKLLFLTRTGELIPVKKQNELASFEGAKGLLLVHGIISSTEAAFSSWYKNTEIFGTVYDRYSSNVIAYDHWTLSKDCLENAKSLALKLPENTTLDIVCHSRGASVVRCLLEHPDCMALLNNRNIHFDKAIYVAGACEGSALAKKESVDQLFKIYSIASAIVPGAVKISGEFIAILLKQFLFSAQNLPGTDCLDPDSDLFKELKNSNKTLGKQYFYIRANAKISNPLLHFSIESVIDKIVFQNMPNDMVVPFVGAGPETKYLQGVIPKVELKAFGSATEDQEEIWHITFFKNMEVQKLLLNNLTP